jgi:hypothetical protein
MFQSVFTARVTHLAALTDSLMADLVATSIGLRVDEGRLPGSVLMGNTRHFATHWMGDDLRKISGEHASATKVPLGDLRYAEWLLLLTSERLVYSVKEDGTCLACLYTLPGGPSASLAMEFFRLTSDESVFEKV